MNVQAERKLATVRMVCSISVSVYLPFAWRCKTKNPEKTKQSDVSKPTFLNRKFLAEILLTYWTKRCRSGQILYGWRAERVRGKKTSIQRGALRNLHFSVGIVQFAIWYAWISGWFRTINAKPRYHVCLFVCLISLELVTGHSDLPPQGGRRVKIALPYQQTGWFVVHHRSLLVAWIF